MPLEIKEISRELKERLRNELNERRHLEDSELFELIDERILEASRQNHLPLSEKSALRKSLFNSFRRLDDVLQAAVDDPEVSEIMINGKDTVFVEKNGKMIPWPRAFDTEEQLEDMIQQIVSRVNRVVNVSSPIVDARLEDGARVHVVLPPISLSGPVVTIRKFPEPITMEKLVSYGSLSEEAACFLQKLVKAGYNIFISGGTNSGKSTFLNALSAFIPEDERVITIEDSAELQIQHVPNLVRLETRNVNTQGEGEITIGDLIRAALRMNPDRIVVGEVRGKEASELLNSMNTGHDGSLSTGHGNSPKDMLNRLETMVLTGVELPLPAIRSQIASAVDIIIHLGRLRDKSRRVLSIAEIGGVSNGEIQLNLLYQFEEETSSNPDQVAGQLKKTGELKDKRKLLAAGLRL